MVGEIVENDRPLAIQVLQRVMARAGWEVDYVDMDLTGSVPKAEIKIHRHDGRWLWGRVDRLGRCMLETYQRETSLGESACYGKMAPRCVRHEDIFLGRRNPPGPRAMMRQVTDYIVDNALSPVSRAEVRSAWATVMAVPTRLPTLPGESQALPALYHGTSTGGGEEAIVVKALQSAGVLAKPGPVKKPAAPRPS